MITKRKPTHPGEIFLDEVIKPLDMTITEAAASLNISRKTMSEIVNGKSPITPNIAVRIGEATGTSAQSWMNMQLAVDLWEAEHNQANHKVRKFKVAML